MPAINEAIGSVRSTGGSASGLQSMLSPLWSSALSSFGSSAGSGLGDALFGGISARRQWKYMQKQMAKQQEYALEQMAKSAEYQLTHDKEMFDYQNAYNDPSKVFDRYLKAGVTPAGVLGSSGVGVNATMSAGSGSAPFGNIPSGGSGIIGAGKAFQGDPLALANLEVAKSTAARNRADADRARADADNIRNSTHEAGFQKLFDNAQLALARAQEKHELSLSEYTSTQNALMSFDLIVRQWTVGGEIDAVLADYQSKINVAKAGNIQNEYLRAQLDSQLLLTWSMYQSNTADASYKSQLSQLTSAQIIDLQNEIANNWDKRWELTDASGNKKTYSLKDLFGMLTLADVHAAAWKSAQAEQAAGKAAAERKNEENRWKWETLHAVTSIVQTLMFRSGMRGFGSSTNTVGTDIGTDTSSQSTRTTILDASGNPKGYVIREMSGTRNSSSARNSQSRTKR